MLLHWGLRRSYFISSAKSGLSLEKQQAMNINREVIAELCHVFQPFTNELYKCNYFFLVQMRTPNSSSLWYIGNSGPGSSEL